MHKKFNILLRQRVPFLTSGSWALIGGCFLILFILWIFMLPANGSQSSGEMKTVYYILAVPEWVKYLSSFAGLGLLVLIPLNLLRLKRVSSLDIFDNYLSIKNKRLNITIQIATIKKIFVNDLTNYMGQSKFRLQIVITYDYDKNLSFLLMNYGDSDDLIDSLSHINPDKFRFFDKEMPAIEDEI
jgi:hypothetical protein